LLGGIAELRAETADEALLGAGAGVWLGTGSPVLVLLVLLQQQQVCSSSVGDRVSLTANLTPDPDACSARFVVRLSENVCISSKADFILRVNTKSTD